jgi:hypothetical protein
MAQQSSATASVATAASSSALTCPTGTDCQKYTLSVSAVAATIGAFASGGTTFTAGTGAASYTVEGHAFGAGSGGKDDCSPAVVTSTAVAVTAGATATVPTLAFVGCS